MKTIDAFIDRHTGIFLVALLAFALVVPAMIEAWL